MTTKYVQAPLNPSHASTRTLIAGLTRGFNFASYEMEAVEELVRRGKQDTLRALYEGDKPLRKLARAAIRRQLKLSR